MSFLELFDAWRFLAGLGIFLIGMFFVEESLINLAGRTFKKFLRKYTSHPIKGILSGAFITGLLQSSSVVSLMLLAFVGAEILSLKNAIGVILGSNLGTTLTGWIVTYLGFKLDIESFALPFIAIGGFLHMYRKGKGGYIGKFMIGFGFIFLGLDFMKSTIDHIATQFDLSIYADANPYIFFLIGLLFTALVQSSSASIVIILSGLSTGMISLTSGAAMAIGSDLGTTITTIFGGLNGSPVKKRVVLSHVLFNLITGLLALVFLNYLLALITQIFKIQDPLVALVTFHSLFNLLGILVLLPFIGIFSRFIENRFANDKTSLALFIHKVPPHVSDAAMEALGGEIIHLIDQVFILILKVLQINRSLFPFPENLQKSPLTNPNRDLSLYSGIKQLEGEIVEYYLKIPTGELMEEESARLDQSIHSVRNAVTAAKGIKDIQHNILDFEKSVNEHKIALYEFMIAKEHEWYLKLNRLFHSEPSEIYAETLADLQQENKGFYDEFVREIYKQTLDDQLKEVDISTLLNVNRELHHVNQSILNAVRDMLLKDDRHISLPQNLSKG